LPRPFITSDISGQLIFLGTGTSVGVPMIGCGCAVCTSDDPRNKRLRCSIILGLPQGNLLVDTTPDMRTQLLRERIGVVHAVLFTHEHVDHLYGLDDLRLFPHYTGQRVPIYCEPAVERRIRSSFDYCFSPEAQEFPPGALPQLDFEPIAREPFWVLGERVVPLRLIHGRLPILGFRFGNIAYCTDVSEIPDETWPLLDGLDVLVLDSLRSRPHPTHFSLEEAIEAAQRIGAKRTLFTHMSHELDHAATNAQLPPGIELAYDGLRLPLSSVCTG
jgi:phosphoribosyl 1,2-cyclic phosphate phosphodiesterase